MCLIISKLPDGKLTRSAIVYGQIITFALAERFQLPDAPRVERQSHARHRCPRRGCRPSPPHPFAVSPICRESKPFGIVAPNVARALADGLGSHANSSFALSTLPRRLVQARRTVADNASHAVVVGFKAVVVSYNQAFRVEVRMVQRNTMT